MLRHNNVTFERLASVFPERLSQCMEFSQRIKIEGNCKSLISLRGPRTRTRIDGVFILVLELPEMLFYKCTVYNPIYGLGILCGIITQI